MGTVPDGSPINTTYSYDSLNRLSSIQRSDGSLSLISYNNPDKLLLFYVDYPNPADRTSGSVTLYPYDLGQSSRSVVVGNAYFFSAGAQGFDLSSTLASLNLKTHYKDVTYALDATKHLLRYSQSVPPGGAELERSEYGYTQENITSVVQSSFDVSSGKLRSQTSFVLAYDDKHNPYFGLLDTALDPRLRFSANNVLTNTLTSSAAPSFNDVYRYEYNQQGLPIKSSLERSGTTYTTTYTYESY
ncbi:hypothetical protein GCM10028818_52300 [Spirosoma horti]